MQCETCLKNAEMKNRKGKSVFVSCQFVPKFKQKEIIHSKPRTSVLAYLKTFENCVFIKITLFLPEPNFARTFFPGIYFAIPHFDNIARSYFRKFREFTIFFGGYAEIEEPNILSHF